MPRPGRDTIGRWVPANHACPPGNPSNSFKPSCPRRSLPRQHFGPISPLAATLIDLPTSVANKRLTVRLNPLDATLTKNIEWESGTIFHVTVHSTPTPIFRTLFQVPYPATPLSATLTKTAGCHPPFSFPCGTQRNTDPLGTICPKGHTVPPPSAFNTGQCLVSPTIRLLASPLFDRLPPSDSSQR